MSWLTKIFGGTSNADLASKVLASSTVKTAVKSFVNGVEPLIEAELKKRYANSNAEDIMGLIMSIVNEQIDKL